MNLHLFSIFDFQGSSVRILAGPTPPVPQQLLYVERAVNPQLGLHPDDP